MGSLQQRNWEIAWQGIAHYPRVLGFFLGAGLSTLWFSGILFVGLSIPLLMEPMPPLIFQGGLVVQVSFSSIMRLPHQVLFVPLSCRHLVLLCCLGAGLTVW
jgi:hypothetical protein